MSRAHGNQGRHPLGAARGDAGEPDNTSEDRLLAKHAQLARFGLAAEAAPILVPADPEER